MKVRYAIAWLLLLLSSLVRAAPMGESDARHLLGRTAFGANNAEIKEWAGYSRQQAIEVLLRRTDWRGEVAPSLEYIPHRRLKDLDAEARQAFQRDQRERGIEARVWWLQRMIDAPTPADQLHERMTLFWHNHFVSSITKVKSTRLMLEQNQLLRRHALGSFASLLHEVSKDPAMVIYLDSASNRRGNPNENFSREVMELFTLGEGNYSETDIKEAARAFTGWSIDPESGQFVWRERAHDDGEKTLFGQQGRWDGDAVLDILLAQPNTAEFVVGKLWREFVAPSATLAEQKEIRRIARHFRDSRYDIRVALRELLSSPAFWVERNRGALIKSPVDFVIGTLRSFDVDPPEGRQLVHVLTQLGQDVFSPPNVRGWPGGETWINSSTLLARKQFAERISRRMGHVSADLMDPRYQLK